MKGTTLAWLAFVGATTYKWEQTSRGTLPPPSIYLGSAVIYSLLGLLAGPAPALATVTGWAVVVGALTTGALLPGTGAPTTPGRTVRSGSGRTAHTSATGPTGPVGPGF